MAFLEEPKIAETCGADEIRIDASTADKPRD